eukprot:2583592-Amphidinium_carterae.1
MALSSYSDCGSMAIAPQRGHVVMNKSQSFSRTKPTQHVPTIAGFPLPSLCVRLLATYRHESYGLYASSHTRRREQHTFPNVLA